jgi:hypothetical protein
MAYGQDLSGPKVKTETIDGRTFDIHVNGIGQFWTLDDGDSIMAESLDLLLTKLRRMLRTERTRINIPITMLYESRAAAGRDVPVYRHAVITGVHSRSGNTLVRFEDTGKSDQLSGFSSDGIMCKRLTPAQVKEFEQLAKAVTLADKAYDTFKLDVQLATGRRGVTELIQVELEKAQAAEPDAPSGDPRVDAPAKRKR